LTTRAYYNEVDPFAAAWLRELIKRNLIAPGEVDERDIRDIHPHELVGFNQHHFFAGIGVWSYALRLAGWPDEKPVWTGSCPCQPFSAAGKGAGTTDERHLWPSFFHLISELRPPVVFGEQVEAAIKHGWLDLVQDDLEGSGYATAAVGFPAASVGAPHIRQRLYFVADSDHSRPQGRAGVQERSSERIAGSGGLVGELADSSDQRRIGWRTGEAGRGSVELERPRDAGSLADTNGRNSSAEGVQRSREHGLVAEDNSTVQLAHTVGNERRQVSKDSRRSDQGSEAEGLEQRSLHSSHWSNADWIYCRDEKYRPVEPGTFPLAHGATKRVGRLRGYGNAIVAQQAAAFITAYMES
jgi:DNA (cytosine-5)-methyltransferase 1